MASLYRKPVVVTDPATRQKIKAKSKKWWGQYKDALGRLKRVPLAIDKAAAQAMLHQIVQRVEREKAGLVDPTEEQRRRPLAEHLREFDSYLRNRGVSDNQVGQNLTKLRKLVAARKWRLIGDITASGALEFLGQLRREGRSAQTYNNYLTAIKQFARWLVRDRRTPSDPLVHLSRVNTQTDRRHDRRALSQEEFARLIEAARNGKRVEGISGSDRAMMYVLAAWTGFRKGEVGSLTLRSLRLDDDPPTATVAACYSKRRREDTQVLHPEVVRQLRDWLATKPRLAPDVPMFPVSGRVPGGVQRKTSKMIERDLMAARDKWLDEAKEDQAELQRRLKTDFLCQCNHDGRYADFHSLRHWFITGLARAGISPKMAQTLARHSDIRLTLGVYTHVELPDRSAAIESLPPPERRKQAAPRMRGRRTRREADALGRRHLPVLPPVLSLPPAVRALVLYGVPNYGTPCLSLHRNPARSPGDHRFS
jgi:site-specific recombinase XerD